MSQRSQLRKLLSAGGPMTFSAWTMAIVFATVAMISFAIDQAVILLPVAEEQAGTESALAAAPRAADRSR